MNELAIKRALSERTRKESITVSGGVFSLHITKNREVIVTDNYDFSKVYAVLSLDFYNRITERENRKMNEDYRDWVTKRLTVDEPEPICPFYHTPVYYCNAAYSEKCYTCDEAKGEWAGRQSNETG